MNRILLFAISFLLLLGCSKRNSPTPGKVSNSTIVGKWVSSADTLKIYNNGTLSKTYIFTGNPIQLSDIQFNQDGSLVWISETDSSDKLNGSYVIANNIITFNHPTTNINGNLTEAYSQNATIRELTSNKLTIVFDDSTTSNGNTERDYEIVYYTR